MRTWNPAACLPSCACLLATLLFAASGAAAEDKGAGANLVALTYCEAHSAGGEAGKDIADPTYQGCLLGVVVADQNRKINSACRKECRHWVNGIADLRIPGLTAGALIRKADICAAECNNTAQHPEKIRRAFARFR